MADKIPEVVKPLAILTRGLCSGCISRRMAVPVLTSFCEPRLALSNLVTILSDVELSLYDSPWPVVAPSQPWWPPPRYNSGMRRMATKGPPPTYTETCTHCGAVIPVRDVINIDAEHIRPSLIG